MGLQADANKDSPNNVENLEEGSGTDLKDEEAIAELTEQLRRYLEGEQDNLPELPIYRERRRRSIAGLSQQNREETDPIAKRELRRQMREALLVATTRLAVAPGEVKLHAKLPSGREVTLEASASSIERWREITEARIEYMLNRKPHWS